MNDGGLLRRGVVLPLLLYAALFVAAAVICPFVGSESLDYRKVLSLAGEAGGTDADIFFFQRLPRVLLALMVGGTLAMAGATFQVILRNPLAEPFTLGVTGGAAVGAVLAISVPGLWLSWGPFSTVQLFALVGAAAALGLIYAMARRPEGMAMHTLLLAGVTISILCAGAVLLIRYIVSPHLLVRMDQWMMGGLDVIGYRELAALFPLLLPGLALLAMQARSLNHLALGAEMARGHGVDVAAVQKEAFIGGGAATAAVVSLAGPIGFVGLIVPHAVRRLSGFDHRVVLAGSFLLGGAALAFCDALARVILAPAEIPVGIITALVGGPLFIRLLLKGRAAG